MGASRFDRHMQAFEVLAQAFVMIPMSLSVIGSRDHRAE